MTVDLDLLVDAARRLPGVLDVRLTTAEDGTFELAHLELSPAADRTATALAVLSLLRQHLELPVPDDAVRLHDAGGAGPPDLPLQRGSRPVILRSELSTTGLESTSTVVLTCDDRVAAGEAVGASTATAIRRSTSQATLTAVQHLMGDRVRFDLHAVDVVGHGGDSSVLVVLSLVSAHGVERLTGAAVVRDDESRAVIRATLDGVNRRLETLLV